MDYISLEDYEKGKYDLKMDDLSLDKEDVDFWLSRNFYLQMMDIWGEVDKLKSLSGDDLIYQINRIREYMTIVKYSIKNDFSESGKQTLRIAEWELMDFYLWNNEFHNTKETVSRWFDQWCYNINLNLLYE